MASCEHCGQTHAVETLYCPTTGKLVPSHIMPAGTLLENKYLVGRAVGVGGMGAVFEGRHTLLEKRVAIKVILPGIDHDEQLTARLVQEAQAASATGHRNVATVTDMGHTPSGSLFVVMEFLDGCTLKSLVIDDSWVPVDRAVSLIRQVLSGLAAVHRKGIVHRDLKPDNLMLVTDEDSGEEVVKILDFGISKIVAKDAQSLNLTRDGLVLGTPQYMSPEQASGLSTIDHRTDIYSTAAILYQLVTGTVPHPAESLNELIAATIQARIDPPSQRNPRVPVALDRVLLRALARRPEERYADAQSFREALKPFVAPSADDPHLPASAGRGPLSDWDESSLVDLDEVSVPRGAAPPRTAQTMPEVAPPATDAQFAPPVDEVKELELDGAGPTAQRSLVPTPPPSAGPHPKVEPRQRATRPYGQARTQPPVRWGLWVLLGVAVLGGGAYWLLAGRTPATSAGARTEMVRLTFNINPGHAEVLVDGVLQTSSQMQFPKGDREVQITVRCKGYISVTTSARADRDRTLLIELKQRPGSSSE
jgi:eukaryotic-like serine/threonine-protein kinase